MLFLIFFKKDNLLSSTCIFLEQFLDILDITRKSHSEFYLLELKNY